MCSTCCALGVVVMCSTCCSLGVVGEYREKQFLLATCVGSIMCGRLGAEEKIILKWL